MIDDLRYIHDKDSADALGIAGKQWQQLEHEFDIPQLDFKPDNIVYAGMGGSALAARLSISWPGYSVPFEIVTQYHVPSYVSERTLFIASSYSGNTEEELSCISEAADKDAFIIVIASGGKLKEVAEEKGYVYVNLPTAAQPRYAFLYSFKALVVILERLGLVAESDSEKQIHEAAGFLKESLEKWSPEKLTADNPAKALAKDLAGTSVVVYAGPLLAPAAYKWKISINENAKNVAWAGYYPEFNHNEFIGWSGLPHDKPYSVIDLRSNLEHPQIQKRFEVSARLLSGKRPAPKVVEAQGQTLLQQLLWTVAYGDFVSLYLALINGVDPAPVELVERLKKEIT